MVSAFASGSFDATVRVWDAVSGAELLCLRGHESMVFDVSFSPDGQRLISGSWDKTVRVWNATSGAELLCLRGHEDRVCSVSFSPDGQRLVSVSLDDTVRTWDAASGACLEVTKGLGDVVAIAGREQSFPCRAVGGGLETVFDASITREPVAWFPMADINVRHPSCRTWAGSVSNYVCLVTLEGNSPSAN